MAQKKQIYAFIPENPDSIGQDKRDKRVWTFSGTVFSDQLVISFAEDNTAKKSAGVMLVRKQASKDNWLSGFYHEFAKFDDNRILIPIPITLKKKVMD